MAELNILGNGPARTRRTEAKASSGVDLGPLEGWIGFHLRLAQNASFQAFAREARGIDLSPGRFAVLMLIGRNPGISQTALSRANARDKSSLTPVLDDLERRKLIKRTRTRRDRRSYQLTLTPAGDRLLQQLTACAERHDANLDRIIGTKNKARFLQTLKKLIAELAGDERANGASRERD
ncbi:MAG: MarR family transcriptional regulator [Bradyrhizobiaceae bacterium]|nr:MarR family transcriptional regulator [Bradyrhizobiaceae bacterium]